MIAWRDILSRRRYLDRLATQGQAFAWEAWRQARRAAILLIGASAILLGLVFLITPGPGLAVILVGIAVLATEFLWARLLLNRLRRDALGIASSFRRGWRRGLSHALRRAGFRTYLIARGLRREARRMPRTPETPGGGQGTSG